MLVHRRVTPSIKFAGTRLYTWVERGTVRVKCLAQEHKTMSPARAWTRTTRSGDERTNHEATAPPLSIGPFVNLFILGSHLFKPPEIGTRCILLLAFVRAQCIYCTACDAWFFCRRSLWHKAKKCHLTPGQTELKVCFTQIFIPSSLMQGISSDVCLFVCLFFIYLIFLLQSGVINKLLWAKRKGKWFQQSNG